MWVEKKEKRGRNETYRLDRGYEGCVQPLVMHHDRRRLTRLR
jgi:hypothetical protein